MNEIKRTLEAKIKKASDFFKVILLTGPRQVGKTTLLKNLMESNRTYVSFDNIETRLEAMEDPARFIQQLKLPVLVDEVQYVPELFSYIKLIVDQSDEKGLFWLTGSQQFSLMKNVTESLAGRVGIFRLQGITHAEEYGAFELPSFLPTPERIEERAKYLKPMNSAQLYQKIWRGTFPQLVTHGCDFWQIFYESYLTTYLERDVYHYLKINDLISFRKFMQLLAARTSQMLNYRELSKEVGVSEPTIKNWIHVLEATGLIVLLPPFFNNISKRVLKTPKVYFLDTGLCTYLGRWLSPEVLENGAMSGAFLETYVISQIMSSCWHQGQTTNNLYYYGDQDRNEVDLLIHQDGGIYPLEIKKNISIGNTNFKGFGFLDNCGQHVLNPSIINLGQELCFTRGNIQVIPIGYL